MMDQALEQALLKYKPTSDAIGLVQQTAILFLVGPTGAGKDALKDKLIAGGGYHHIISHTTRPPRINHGVMERNGQEYHFIDMTTAEAMLQNQEFIEAKIYSDNLYGTSVAEIQAAHDEGKIAMTDLEVQGVAEYKNFDSKVLAVFLLPPDFATWQARLQRRYGDVVDADDYCLRLNTALSELEQLLSTNYYMAVINDDLDKALAEVQAIATTKVHEAADEAQARAVAEALVRDIKAYLDKS